MLKVLNFVYSEWKASHNSEPRYSFRRISVKLFTESVFHFWMIFASFAVYTCTLDRTTPAKHKRKIAVADNSPRDVASECVNSLKIEFKTEFCVLDSVFLRPQKVESIYKIHSETRMKCETEILAMYNAPRLLHNTSDMPISFISESFFEIVSSRPNIPLGISTPMLKPSFLSLTSSLLSAKEEQKQARIF